MSKTINVNGKDYEVVSASKGWVKYLDDSGSIRSIRSKSAKAAKAPKAAKPVKAPKAAKAAKAAKPTERTLGEAVFDLSRYERVSTPSGNVSYDNGDKAAKALRGLTLDQTYREVAKTVKDDLEAKTIDDAVDILRKKYGKLNPGMQRMNLGNRYRAALRAV